MEGVQFDINVITGGSNGAIEGIVGGLGEITGQLNVLNRNFIGFAQQSTSGLESVNKRVQETESGFTKLGKAAFGLNNINQALSGITNDLNNAVEPGIKFNSQLKDMQAITGVTNEQMDAMGESARKNAKDFGIDAATGVETYTLLLSKLGPELSKTPQYLNEMGRDAAILSKQLKGDTAGATEVLTTAMNQYGISIKNPAEATKAMGAMMNIMSASAVEGSARLPQIKSALEESGMVAKSANVSFAELNASIQVLDKSGKKGAEGGVAIRNVLTELALGKFMHPVQLEMLKAAGISVEGLSDKSKSFADRLRMLSPIVNDNAAMAKLFGKENMAAGIALVQGANEIDRFTGKITGTNAAVTVANTVMSSYQEKVYRAMAKIHDFGISIFSATQPILPFITMGMGALQVMANMGMAANLFSMISIPKFITGMGAGIGSMVTWIGTTVTATAAQWGLNIALSANPVGLIVIGITALVAALVVAYNKCETFRAAISGLIEAGKVIGSVYVAVGKTIIGALTLNPTMFKEGLEDTGKAVSTILGGGITKAFSKGFDDSMSESKRKAAMEKATTGAVDDITGKVNIAIPGITSQGKANKDSALDGFDPHKHKRGNKEGHELASNITAGGRRPTTIHLTIQKVIGIGEMKTTNFIGSAKEAGKQVVEEVLMALQSVNGKVSME